MEFRFLKVGEGADNVEEYGSKETEIARSVERRQMELSMKESGIEAPAHTWTELEAPLLFKGEEKEVYNLECQASFG